jgi:HD-GYP domain-containing protein (c-di-GMP phosphodiesterase class II)
MARTSISDLAAAAGQPRRQATSALVRIRALAGLGAGAERVSRADSAQSACETLAELLGLDASWVLAGSAVDMLVLARWARPGAAAARLGAHRLRVLAGAAVDEVSQGHDGRYLVVVVRLPDGPGQTLFLVGAVRSGRLLPEDDLACAQLVAAAYAERLRRPAVPARPPASASPVGERLHVLQTITGTMAAGRTEVEVAEAVAAGASELVDGAECRCYLISPAGELMPAAGPAGRPAAAAAGRAVAAQEPLVVAGPLGESLLALPLLAGGRTLGAIVVSRSGSGFSDADQQLLQGVASTAAAACSSARMQEQAREQAEVARALLELGAVLALQGDVDQVARMVAIAIDRLVDSAALSVWLREGDALHLAGHAGYTPEEAGRLGALPLDATGAPLAEALERRSMTVLDLADCGELATRLAGSTPGTLLALVAIGERAGNRGLVAVQRGLRRGAPGYRDEQMLLGIADQALLALTNRRLYRELEESFLATVKALANALETKDEYTGDHAQALVGLSTDVARRLGVQGAALRDISFAAALHDVGKIGVPLEILNKPGALSDEEWDVMKLHPQLGARIIEPVPALAGARELVLACHEHWDGSGYPRGLAGERIPLGARVILACDAWHAMTSDRVYRQALPQSDALAELERCAGSSFDPEVAFALIGALREGGAMPDRDLTAA